MTYLQVETGPLTDRQVSRIRLFSRQGTRGESIRIRLSPKQLNGGGTMFLVTKRDHDKMTVAKAENKSVMIQLSLNWIKENQRKGFYQKLTDGHMKRSQQSGKGQEGQEGQEGRGPLLAALGSQLLSTGMSSVMSGLNADTPGRRKIYARIRQLQGSGTGGSAGAEAIKKGIELATDPNVRAVIGNKDLDDPQTKKDLMEKFQEAGLIQQKGEGQQGSGFFSDLWEGFKFGITDPIGAISLVAGEIDRAISGKGTVKGGKKPEMGGSGLKFY